MNQQNEGAATSRELSAEQFYQEWAKTKFRNQPKLLPYFSEWMEFAEAYAHGVRQAQEKLCTHDAMCPVCCRPCVVDEEIRPFKSSGHSLERVTFEQWYGNRPANRKEVSWETWRAAAHAVRQVAECHLEDKQWEINNRLQEIGELKRENASLTAERDALKEWRDSISAAIKLIPEFAAGEWGGDKEGWGFHLEMVNFCRRERERAEAALREAASEPRQMFNFMRDFSDIAYRDDNGWEQHFEGARVEVHK